VEEIPGYGKSLARFKLLQIERKSSLTSFCKNRKQRNEREKI
jgi:hypothetical protein